MKFKNVKQWSSLYIFSNMNLREKLKEISILPVESLLDEYKLLLHESIEQKDIAVQFSCLKNIARIYNYVV